MNKEIRNGINVEVAFTSGAKRMAATAGSPSQQAVALESMLSAQGLRSTEQDYSRGSGMSNKIKVFLRPVARAIYRASAPFLRPVAFRLRAYLFAGLPRVPPQDLSAVLAELSAIKSELLDQRNSARRYPADRMELSARNLTNLSQAAINQLDRIKQYVVDQPYSRQIDTNRLNQIEQSARDQTEVLQTHVNRLERMEQYLIVSARRFAINCGPGEVLVRSEVGYILCSPSDHALLALLVESGELERGTRLLIQGFLKPNDVFIDVGANVGMHTLAAAQAMQGRGRIIAFEPFEPTQRLLAKSIWLNGFAEMTEIHQAAVSNRRGHQTLFLGAASGHHSLFPLTTSSYFAPQPVEVALVRLDDVVTDSTQVDLIKIDVEGAELDVLEGARPIIARSPSIALVVEFGFSHLGRTGHTTKDWLAAFHSVGLVHRAINRDTGRLEDWSVAQLEAADSVNLFFARPKSPAWTKAGMAL